MSDNAAREAFRWTANDGPLELGFLPGGLSSAATAITPDGSVVIGTSSSNSGTRGFRWTTDDGMVAISGLGMGSVQPMAVSDDGSFVVGAADGDGLQAFIWTEEGGTVALQPLLTHFGLDLTGWRLAQARAISADGKTIAGLGFNARGFPEAWLATVPEPSTWLLAGMALGFATLTKLLCRHRPN
jgi:uncharacterized membrane protein